MFSWFDVRRSDRLWRLDSMRSSRGYARQPSRTVLEELWIHSDLLNCIRERKQLRGNCEKCAYNGLCEGCQITAYIASKNWLGPDVQCPFGPKITRS